MAEVTINNSPVHGDSTLTAVYGETGQYWANFHTGTDFVPYGTTPPRPTLYSVCSGTVVNVIFYTGSQALGNQVVIQDSGTGYYWRYCHMTQILVSIGDTVTTTTQVGVMGDTGNVTGVHLHLEYSRVSYWDSTYTYFLNPSTALNIPNVRGTIVHYDGSVTPPEPPIKLRKGNWIWPFSNKKKKQFLYN